MATSTSQDPSTTLLDWSCYSGGFKREPSITNNKLSSLHLTELLLASSLNQMERILLPSQWAVSLPNFKQFNSSFLLKKWDLFSHAVRCVLSSLSSLFMYCFARSFYSQTVGPHKEQSQPHTAVQIINLLIWVSLSVSTVETPWIKTAMYSFKNRKWSCRRYVDNWHPVIISGAVKIYWNIQKSY